MKAVFLDAATLGADIDLSSLTRLLPLQQFGQTPKNEQIIVERIGDAECVITNKVPIEQKTIARCPNLKVILTAATGVDHVDVKAAAAAQIPVCNTRNYAGPSLAQHVMASILYFANQHHKYNALVMDGSWSKQDMFCILPYPITELAGKTLGIIGYGNLGKQVAQLARAFDMNIILCESLHQNTENAASLHDREQAANRKPFAELLATSDYISLHCPLTATTRQLFSLATFKAMKSTAILINTARGDIVDTQALLTALDHGIIAGAALDVFSQEPLASDHALLQPRKNLLLTPHNAWGSQESRQRLVQELRLNLQAWLNGDIRNQIIL